LPTAQPALQDVILRTKGFLQTGAAGGPSGFAATSNPGRPAARSAQTKGRGKENRTPSNGGRPQTSRVFRPSTVSKGRGRGTNGVGGRGATRGSSVGDSSRRAAVKTTRSPSNEKPRRSAEVVAVKEEPQPRLWRPATAPVSSSKMRSKSRDTPKPSSRQSAATPTVRFADEVAEPAAQRVWGPAARKSEPLLAKPDRREPKAATKPKSTPDTKAAAARPKAPAKATEQAPKAAPTPAAPSGKVNLTGRRWSAGGARASAVEAAPQGSPPVDDPEVAAVGSNQDAVADSVETVTEHHDIATDEETAENRAKEDEAVEKESVDAAVEDEVVEKEAGNSEVEQPQEQDDVEQEAEDEATGEDDEVLEEAAEDAQEDAEDDEEEDEEQPGQVAGIAGAVEEVDGGRAASSNADGAAAITTHRRRQNSSGAHSDVSEVTSSHGASPPRPVATDELQAQFDKKKLHEDVFENDPTARVADCAEDATLGDEEETSSSADEDEEADADVSK